MTRGQAKTTDNSEYLAFTSEILRKLHYRLLVRKYVRGITPQKKAQLQQKFVTSSIFKGKKESYPQSVAQPFVDTRIS
ncbi:hypothetical protein INR49_006200 [Caranx melampygus]|nr:hypothetical protein INR49_006200 [Caranx melampygus]